MHKQNQKYQKPQMRQIISEKTGGLTVGFATSWAFHLMVVLLALLLCSGVAGAYFYSNNHYTFHTIFNANYIYQWSSSAGTYQENDKDAFLWIAPDVDRPTEVTISVKVINRTCLCKTSDSIRIMIRPVEATRPNINYTFDKANSSQIGNIADLNLTSTDPENVEFIKNLTFETKNITETLQPDLIRNDTSIENETMRPENDKNQIMAFIGHETATFADLTSGSNFAENFENYSTNEATIGETLSTTNAYPSAAAEDPEVASDQSNQATTAEDPLAAEVQIDQSLAEEICTLSFGDGVEVDIVFEQSNSLADTAYVIIQEAAKELIGSGTFSDRANASASLTNTTLIPVPGVDQSGPNTNRTETENGLSEIGAGSMEETDKPPEQSNAVVIGSEAAADPNPNENPPMQAINQTDIGIS